MSFDHLPEPPPGATVRDDRGHEWRREPWAEERWWGCCTCDDRQVLVWSWRMILQDSYDTVLAVEMP